MNKVKDFGDASKSDLVRSAPSTTAKAPKPSQPAAGALVRPARFDHR
jgi:hypothetical protein